MGLIGSKMPAFQRKSYKLKSAGMNLTLPLDQIPEGQYSYLKNVRNYSSGGFFCRPGLTSISNDFGGANYLHSLLRLNDSSPDTTFAWCRFVGADTGKLSFGQTTFAEVQNPLTSADLTLSGNPLSLIPFRPTAAPSTAIYVGDYYAPGGVPQQMKSVFFRPTDTLGGGPICYLMGVPPPNDDIIPTNVSTGNLNGTYWWRFVAINKFTGARSNPSNVTRIDITPDPNFSAGGGLVLTNDYASMTLPNMPVQTLSPGDFSIRVYRFGGTIFDWRFVGEGDPADTFKDNLSDIDIESAESLPLDSSGANYPNVQPFPTLDIGRSGQGTITQPGGAGQPCYLTRTGGDPINNGWPPGTTIFISSSTTRNGFVTYTFPEDTGTPGDQIVELTEDAITILGITTGDTVDWATGVGTIIVGQPLEHMWGPYGSGESALFIFGCGDPRQPGSLYWIDGNNPDSAPLPNRLEVTDPSEPLINGIVFDGRNYVWSSLRMFEIVPNPSVAGQFFARQIPGAAGLYAPWGVCDCGSFMAYIGYDGIFQSQGSSSTSITDEQLYPFMRHDALAGLSFSRGGDTLLPPDPNALNKWRLSWQDGILYFDYPEVSSGFNKALIRGTRQGDDHGWSVDDYNFDGATARLSETTAVTASPNTGVSDKLIGIGGTLYQWGGNDDASFAINWVVESPAFDLGDSRANKLIGDAMVEAVPNGQTVSCYLLATMNTVIITSGNLTASGGVMGFTLFNGNYLTRTVGIRLYGAVTGAGTPEVYEWHPSFVGKPESTQKRIQDWTDDGKKGAKYVRGFVLEGNTATVSGTDLTITANLSVVTAASHVFITADIGNHLVVQSGPAGFTPGTYVITAVDVVGVGSAKLDHPIGTATVASGVWTMGSPKAMQVQSDGGVINATVYISHPGQTEYPYWFTPFTASELRLAPTETTNTWEDFGIRWIWDDYPEYAQIQEDYNKLPFPQYVRGFELEVDTEGATVNFQVQSDQGTVQATPSVNTPVRDILAYGFATPFIASELRVVPLQSWRKFNLRIISDTYPDNAVIRSAWIPIAGGKAAYTRGLRLKADTNNVARSVQVLGSGGILRTTITVQHNGQEIKPYAFTPFVDYLTQLVPDGNWRLWPDGMDWDFDVYPDLTAEQTSITNMGRVGAKYVRGLKLTADTNNIAQSFEIHGDDGALRITLPATAFNGKTTKAFTFTTPPWSPFIDHELYITPLGPARIWLSETEFIFDPYPELTNDQTQITNLGRVGAKYFRGVKLTADTDNVDVAFELYGDGGVLRLTLPASAYDGKTTKAYTFASPSWPPFVDHEVFFKPLGNARIWMDETEFIFDPYPEYTNDQTEITNLGTPDAKFIQGIKLTADTQNNAVGFEIHGDGGALRVTLPPTNFNGKQTIAFPVSTEWNPFIDHEVYIQPLGNARIWMDETKWVWEPSPELASRYKTPSITAGFKNWWHSPYIWLAYVSTTDINLTVTLDSTTETYTFPSSGGAYVRTLIRTLPSKSKYRTYDFTSPSVFRLYLQDSFVLAKEWGRPYDAFSPVHVFGENSVVSGAKI